MAWGFGAATLGIVSIARAALLPGLGEVTGTVNGPEKSSIVPVYLYNSERNVGYGVFAVNGVYRAVDVFPGHYEITVQHRFSPSKVGLEMAPVPVDVIAGGHARADISPRLVPPRQNYTGLETYKNGVDVEPYDTIYPAGPGRKILERTCMVCHGVNFIPSKALSRDGWKALIHLMISRDGEGGLFSGQIKSGPPILNRVTRHLSDKDMPILLDYLAANFGPNAKQRAVLQDKWPPVSRTALAKAEFIEYRFPPTKEMPRRMSQEEHFDANGNVYISEPLERAIIWLDPRTGSSKTWVIPGKASTHGITVDGDGTVWFSGSGNFVVHLDPKTGLFDQYRDPETGLHGNTPAFTSKGDLWFSELIGNKIGHWSRATNRITYWNVPVPDSDPYGLIVDHHDKVWWADYFTGAISRFDPKTNKFSRFPLKTWPDSVRRLVADSKDNIWYGVYGYNPGLNRYGKIGRLDIKTGQMTEYTLPIEYSQPYKVVADTHDNIWVASMNYLTKFDQKSKKFTVYPLPERTDEPKIQVTRDGAVWYPARFAGIYGEGGLEGVLYPDKDAIRTLGAYYWPGSVADNIARYHGPFTKVTGAVVCSKDGAQNPNVPDPDFGRPKPCHGSVVNKGPAGID